MLSVLNVGCCCVKHNTCQLPLPFQKEEVINPVLIAKWLHQQVKITAWGHGIKLLRETV
jgi:hypothetical protein